MNEKPLERLNYYNGQRLEASHLKLEQEYFIRVRRWLNRSLYSQGIADGLEVRVEPNSSTVAVGPGLALDIDGREIILVEEERVTALYEEAYLTIQYREETLAEDQAGCSPHSSTPGQAGSRLAWGGPSRVLARPLLSWSDGLPHESSGKVILARVTLDAKCAMVETVEADVRRYVGEASQAKVHQYALEGERHIDAANAGRIYFHIRGRQPSAVTLYLRAEKFSSLYYTELGRHNHAIAVNVNSLTIPTHKHTLTLDAATGGTGEAGLHAHTIDEIRARSTRVVAGNQMIVTAPVDPTGIATADQSLSSWTNARFNIQTKEAHWHAVPSSTDPDPQKTLSLSGTGTSDRAGVSDPAYSSRGGDAANRPDPINNPIAPLTYVADLQVIIDGKNVSTAVVEQLKDIDQNWQSNGQDRLGNGSANHPLADKGSGPIKLDFLSTELSFLEGEHWIELSVKSGGGRILYNLYVE